LDGLGEQSFGLVPLVALHGFQPPQRQLPRLDHLLSDRVAATGAAAGREQRGDQGKAPERGRRKAKRSREVAR
jgi:hypothetical protein